jgi:hypothetical protein
MVPFGEVKFFKGANMAVAKQKLAALHPVTNDAAQAISFEEPFIVAFAIEGTAPLIFHRWSCEDVAEKEKAKKGSKAKKTDNVESYVYRNELNQICLPGEYIRQSMIHAAKFKQDPRSPRKSAMDLFKAGIVALTELAPLNGGTETWDYIDQRRVVIQRSAITRMRPAFSKGWSAEFEFSVLIPEYIEPQLFNEVLALTGRLIGTADGRPSYGRFQINKCSVVGLA